MSRLHFRVLYREFLLRIIDLDLIAPQGDMSRLLGQFASFLVFVSLWLTPVVLGVSGSQPVPEFGLISSWLVEHLLIATTMLVVGLFAVLSWDSSFPDRRDVLILSPLPVPARAIFMAKVTAVATALSLSIATLNLFTGLSAPFAFAAAPTMPPPVYDRALQPATAADINAVLDEDLKPFLAANGLLAPGSTRGVSIGVLKQGERRVLTYGSAKPDSIYEIASVTKTFTALLLARLAVEGRVHLDEPVRALLPQFNVTAKAQPEITLQDLATHHSGLPGMPENLNRNGYPNPGADYRIHDLNAYIVQHGLAKPSNPSFRYSNLGFALLGTALASRAKTTYASLLADSITRPLGMEDTTLVLTPDQNKRLIQAYNLHDKPIRAWDLDVLAPAGAIRSTAGDMLEYVNAQLHPEMLAPPLRDAVKESQRLRADAGSGLRMGLAWIYNPETSIYWHNGSISGYTSYVFFNLKGDFGGVVLFNAVRPGGFAQTLGQHLGQRLSGQPAVKVTSGVVSTEIGLAGVLRAFGAYWFTVIAAGVFMFCFVLTIQGVAQLLPRQLFLRFSSLLQILFFVALLTGYFWQPTLVGADTLMDNQQLIFWIPSYWFFGLFQQLNGTVHPLMMPLVKRAWIGLASACTGAAGAYLICYFRTLRKIAEQPDILPDSRRFHWNPRLGGAFPTAVGNFAIRTLLRSRQHRVILSFYLGMALGIAIFVSKAPAMREMRPGDDLWYHTNSSLLVSTSLMLAAAVVGARVVFSIPLEIKANWIFRVSPLPGVPQCVSAARRTIYVLAIAPVWFMLTLALLWLWPLRYALEHSVVLLLLAAIATELCVHGLQKLPFTCSYLPGKSYFHMVILAFLGLMILSMRGAVVERVALDHAGQFAVLIGTLTLIFALLRWRTWRESHAAWSALQFEDPREPAVMSLGLGRDGVMITGQRDGSGGIPGPAAARLQ